MCVKCIFDYFQFAVPSQFRFICILCHSVYVDNRHVASISSITIALFTFAPLSRLRMNILDQIQCSLVLVLIHKRYTFSIG